MAEPLRTMRNANLEMLGPECGTRRLKAVDCIRRHCDSVLTIMRAVGPLSGSRIFTQGVKIAKAPKKPASPATTELPDNALDKVAGGGNVPVQSDYPGKEDFATRGQNPNA